MQRQIAESDWKKWRKLSVVALERYCDRVLNSAAEFSARPGSAHARYAELFQFLRETDKEIERIFDGRRRSNALFQLAAAVTAGIVTPDELLDFSAETREIVAFLSNADG
jgi:hypothetical protein